MTDTIHDLEIFTIRILGPQDAKTNAKNARVATDFWTVSQNRTIGALHFLSGWCGKCKEFIDTTHDS